MKITLVLKGLSLISLIFLMSVALKAHPHLFVEPAVEVMVTEDRVIGLRVTWKWDIWWSMDVIADCDVDRDFFLSEEEVNLVYNNYFNAIESFGYFTEIFVNNRQQQIDKVLNFSAKIEDDETVSYSFTFPLELSTASRPRIRIRFNDRTIYTAFDRDLKLKADKKIELYDIRIATHSYYGVQVDFSVHKPD